MKKYILLLIVFTFFITCKHGQNEPEPLEKPEEVCGCCKVKPIEGYEWHRDLTVWNYPPIQQNQYIGDYLLSLEIPEDILSSLTTGDLLEICLQHPEGIYFYLFSI